MLCGATVAALLHDAIRRADRLGIITGALQDGIGDRGRLLRLGTGEAMIMAFLKLLRTPGNGSLLWMDVAVAVREFMRGDLAHRRPTGRQAPR